MREAIPRPWLLVLSLLLTSGCSTEIPRFNSQFLAFGTLMELTLAGIERPEAERISQQIEADFAAMHKAWHAWDPGPLALINQAFADGKSASSLIFGAFIATTRGVAAHHRGRRSNSYCASNRGWRTYRSKAQRSPPVTPGSNWTSAA